LEIILQVWGGGCYLANKVCFAFSEGKDTNASNRIRVFGWLAYIFGVPPWVVILVGNQNWIAASIEAGGLPAMFLGLYVSWNRGKRPGRWVYRLVAFLTYAALAFGVVNSLYVNGGITTLSQNLEIGVMFGFLLSGYYMAKDKSVGWLYFILGNTSMAALMYIEEAVILMTQQLISLVFVVYGYRRALQKK